MINSENRYSRGMVISLVVIALSGFNFINIDGHQDVKAILIVTLIVCGVGVGIFLINFIAWIRSRK